MAGLGQEREEEGVGGDGADAGLAEKGAVAGLNEVVIGAEGWLGVAARAGAELEEGFGVPEAEAGVRDGLKVAEGAPAEETGEKLKGTRFLCALSVWRVSGVTERIDEEERRDGERKAGRGGQGGSEERARRVRERRRTKRSRET